MYVVVAYDIPDDRRRLQVANALLDFGQRVQYSVFECRLDLDQIERLRQRILPLIDPREDRLRIYRLCAACVGEIAVLGAGKIVEDPDVIVL